MQPLDSIRLCMVYLERLREGLSNLEGPELINQLEVSKEECLLGMAGVEAVVGMGLVFKPAYIPTISFSSLLMTLSNWSNNPKERLSQLCMTFLSVSPKSKVFPLCKEYPILLDLSSKCLVSNHFTRGHLTSFRAF